VKISRIKLDHFRRFSDLEISAIPESARLVVLAGPNGSGKSSLFDGLNVWYQLNSGQGWSGDANYYAKANDATRDISQRVQIDVYGGKNPAQKGAFYFRSAYRNDPEFSLNALNRMGPVVEDLRFRRMIEGDAAVSQNYQRLAAQAFEDIFQKEPPTTTIGQFRESVVGQIRDAVHRLFPDLTLNSLGNPMDQGTFRFNKGVTRGFEYRNLSGGEKAAFDLLIDLFVKRPSFRDAVYCIDEPEAHMNARLQGALLEELYDLIPEGSQLWIATHSIGMMRKARELYLRIPGAVAFLDFGDRDFDQACVITPSRPTRAFWENVLAVALDDLASLVAPGIVIICEGNPAGAIPGKNAEHDATIYNTIFGEEFPDVKFLAGGNSSAVASDRLGFVAALPRIASGIKVSRLIDRDDHSSQDIAKFASEGITTLDRRHLEAYLYDDEVLTALCETVGRPDDAATLIADKKQAIEASVARNNAVDDVKSAAGDIYTKAKQRLGLTGVGNDQMAFARATLAPLIKPSVTIYAELKKAVFGSL
jgi:predicted ATPase